MQVQFGPTYLTAPLSPKGIIQTVAAVLRLGVVHEESIKLNGNQENSKNWNV